MYEMNNGGCSLNTTCRTFNIKVFVKLIFMLQILNEDSIPNEEDSEKSEDLSVSEYCPSSDSGSYGIDTEIESDTELKPDSTSAENLSRTRSADEMGMSSSDNPSPVKVKCLKKDGKRTWDKRHVCVYCKKPQSKLARHLERKHAHEMEVAQALAKPKGSKARRILLDHLRNKGNYIHNIEVLKKRNGEIITVRQPTQKSSWKEYLPCQHCHGFFKRKELWKHNAVCFKGAGKKENAKSRKRVQAVASRSIPIDPGTSKGCKGIIQNMHQDEVSFQVRTDPLICKYGEMMFELHGHDKTQHVYISQKMRELGRFMISVKKRNHTVQRLIDVCVPSRFKLAVEAAKEVSGFDESKKCYKTPSLACKIGYTLKRVSEIVVGNSLMNDDHESGQKAQNFIKLIDSDWNTFVSKRARTNLEQQKWNKADVLPLTEDVVKLQKYLRSLEDKSRQQLNESADPVSWKILAECVLAQLILFNRRREGEAAKLLLETYQKKNTLPLNADVFQSLSKLEQDLSETFTRLEIRGKRGRKVPVLLTDLMCTSLDVLIDLRGRVGVQVSNPYVFARIGADTHIRGSDCLRKFANACGAEFPEHITSTKLRKQVATLCQIMNLKKNEMDQLAKFMGHDIRVHREYYRLSENTLQLAKMSKLLMAIEQGADVYKGKSLDEIDLNIEGWYLICSRLALG